MRSSFIFRASSLRRGRRRFFPFFFLFCIIEFHEFVITIVGVLISVNRKLQRHPGTFMLKERIHLRSPISIQKARSKRGKNCSRQSGVIFRRLTLCDIMSYVISSCQDFANHPASCHAISTICLPETHPLPSNVIYLA